MGVDNLDIAENSFASGGGGMRASKPALHTRSGAPSRPRRSKAARGLTLRLGYRAPFDWGRALAFLAARAIPALETIDGDVYARDGITVRDNPARACLVVEIAPAHAGAAREIAARLRALFDLDADPGAIAGVLARDPTLAPLVAARPGLRVPGAFDPFEVAVRALLGQQVSVRAASTLTARLAAASPITPAALARAVPRIGVPAARSAALRALARAVHTRAVSLERAADPAEAIVALEALPGVGPWTAHYIAMRALGWRDALPAGDLVLRRALGGIVARDLQARAEAWRPWRAYAVLHLWTACAEGDLP